MPKLELQRYCPPTPGRKQKQEKRRSEDMCIWRGRCGWAHCSPPSGSGPRRDFYRDTRSAFGGHPAGRPDLENRGCGVFRSAVCCNRSTGLLATAGYCHRVAQSASLARRCRGYPSPVEKKWRRLVRAQRYSLVVALRLAGKAGAASTARPGRDFVATPQRTLTGLCLSFKQ